MSSRNRALLFVALSCLCAACGESQRSASKENISHVANERIAREEEAAKRAAAEEYEAAVRAAEAKTLKAAPERPFVISREEIRRSGANNAAELLSSISLGSASPYPPPTSLPPPEPIVLAVSPSWNSWFAEDNESIASTPLATPLKLNTNYRLRFAFALADLSRMLPGKVASAPQGPGMKVLDNLGVDSATFSLIVIPSSDAAIHVAQQFRTLDMKFDLRKYRKWTTQAGSASGVLPVVHSFGEAVGEAVVAHADVPFRVLRDGRHEIGLVIVSPSGVPVDAYTAVVCAGIACDARAAGAAPALPPDNALGGDLVLWLHELRTRDIDHEEESYVFAVLVTTDPATRKRRFLSWNLWMSLRSLLDQTKAVRAIVADVANSDAVAEQGAALGRRVFDPVARNATEQAGAAQAKSARETLAQALKIEQGRPVRLVTRVSTSERHAGGNEAFHVFPFSLLAVTHGEPAARFYLGQKFALSVAVPNQSHMVSTACPQDWRMSFPVKLTTGKEDHLQIARDSAEAEFKAWPVRDQVFWETEDFSGEASVKKWFEADVKPGEERTTVFGFLGHHDQNSVFFNKEKGSFSVSQIQRLFKQPSIAILDACDVAMEDVTPGTLVGRLMRHQMGTVVTTTSKVSGPLAAAYLSCMRRVLEKKGNLPVGEMHYYATQCMWSDDDANPWRSEYRFAHSALKYQVFGNPQSLLCYPTATARPE
jgi:hypothetical protein